MKIYSCQSLQGLQQVASIKTLSMLILTIRNFFIIFAMAASVNLLKADCGVCVAYWTIYGGSFNYNTVCTNDSLQTIFTGKIDPVTHCNPGGIYGSAGVGCAKYTISAEVSGTDAGAQIVYTLDSGDRPVAATVSFTNVTKSGSATITFKATGECVVEPYGVIDEEYSVTVPIEADEDSGCGGDCGDDGGGAGGPQDFGKISTSVSSILVAISMGADGPHGPVQRLRLSTDVPMQATPALLSLPTPSIHHTVSTFAPTPSPSVKQQVKSANGLVDVVTIDSYSFKLEFYRASQVSSTKTGDYYTTTGSPFVTYTFTNLNNNINLLRIIETRSSVNRIFDYTYTSAGLKWELLRADNLTKEVVAYTNVSVGAIVRTNKVKEIYAGAQLVKRTAQTYEYRSGVRELLLEETRGSGSQTETDTYVYYANDPVNLGFNANQLERLLRSDGSWEHHVYGEFTQETYAGLGNQSPPAIGVVPTPELNCQKTTVTFDGNRRPVSIEVYLPLESGGSWYWQQVRVTSINLNEVYTQTTTSDAQSGELQDEYSGDYFTEAETSDFRNGRPKFQSRSDGTITLYDYASLSGGAFATTNRIGSFSLNSDGTTANPHGVRGLLNIGSGRETVTITDALGRTASVVTRHVENELAGAIISSLNYTYDDVNDPSGRNHITIDLAGRTNTYVYNDCCGFNQHIDPDGVITDQIYDSQTKRILGATRTHGSAPTITTLNTLDVLGRSLVTTRTASSQPIVMQQNQYDILGNIVRQTNALGGVTISTNVMIGSQRYSTNTYPDDGRRIESYYRDGRLEKVIGTAVFPVRYEYGFELEGSYFREFTKEIKLSFNGSLYQDTDEWVKTYQDGLGRNYKTLYPDDAYSQVFYDANGRVQKSRDPDGVVTLYQYDAEGELEFTAIDMDQDDLIDTNEYDRITRHDHEVEIAHGTTVQKQDTYVYSADNSATETLLNTIEESTDGLWSWNTSWNAGVAITASNRTVYGVNGSRITTNFTQYGNYSVSSYSYGRLQSLTSYNANHQPLGQTTFEYDAHGRQSVIIDARNGSTTNWFNNADQISSTKTPAPASGQSAQVTTNLFDLMGRVWKTTLPDNTSVTNKYDVTGLLTNTAGSRAYPVAYTYDSAGRMKSMTTWTNYSSNLGAATTTWNYDAYRGWMTNKLYTDNKGPSYTYTDAGRLEKRIWARGTNTIYSYNNAGDLSGLDYSDATADVAYEYDRRGRQTSIAQAGGITTTLKYDDAGGLLSESYSGGPLNGLTMTNRYDSLLRRTTNGLWNGSAWLAQSRYSYDNASRLATVGDGTQTAAYSYLANSPLVEKVWFTNNSTLRMTTTKSYDFLNRLTTISSAAGGSNVVTFNYANNSANQRTAITNVDSSRWVYQYDALGQVISGKKYWSDGTPVAGQQFEYSFDDIGNRKTAALGGDATGANLRSANYTNNALNQITSRSVPGYVNVVGIAKTNATVTLWGDNGSYSSTSRKGEYFRGEVASTNTANALWLGITNLAVINNGAGADIVTNTLGKTFVAKTPEVFYYDLDGNLTNDGRWVYTWDAENRLIKQESLSGAPTDSKRQMLWEYDSRSRRIRQITYDGSSGIYDAILNDIKFVSDGWRQIAEISSGNVIRSYTWGLDLNGSLDGAGGVGGLLFMSSLVNGAHYYAYDGNGNVAVLVDVASGAVTARYEYSPFGEVIRATGPLAQLNPFRFSTKYQDAENDLLYYGYRYYSAVAGRWLGYDPIWEVIDISASFGKNNVEYDISIESEENTIHLRRTSVRDLYTFVKNDPISGFDVLGLKGIVFPVCETLKESGCNSSKTEIVLNSRFAKIKREYCVRAKCFYHCRCPDDNCYCYNPKCTRHGIKYGPKIVLGSSARPANCNAIYFSYTVPCGGWGDVLPPSPPRDGSMN